MPRNLGQRLGDTVVNAGTVRTLLGSGTVLEATESSLIPASCSTAPSRWISEVRCCTTLVR
jgi:hypothetical protein